MGNLRSRRKTRLEKRRKRESAELLEWMKLKDWSIFQTPKREDLECWWGLIKTKDWRVQTHTDYQIPYFNPFDPCRSGCINMSRVSTSLSFDHPITQIQWYSANDGFLNSTYRFN
jgi:hypothetical protein